MEKVVKNKWDGSCVLGIGFVSVCLDGYFALP